MILYESFIFSCNDIQIYRKKTISVPKTVNLHIYNVRE